MIQLYPHQKKGSKRLLEHKKYCLFFDVGTGKTFTVLDALTKLPAGKVLISSPKRVLEKVWLKEKQNPNFDISKHDVTYLNYEKISRDKEFKYNEFDYIICDEVHRLKGKTSNVAKTFRRLSKKATHVFGLTGTPIANNYVDIYNIYKAMDIPEFNMTYDEFVFRYYYTKSMEASSGFRFQILLNTKPFMVDELLKRVGRHSMTMRAEDCIDLPRKTIEIIDVAGMVGNKYNEVKDGILKTDKYEKTMTKLETENKLRQVANGFYYDAFKDTHVFKKNNKLKLLTEDLTDLLEETNKTVVVYYYQHDLSELKKLKFKYTLDSDEFIEDDECQILFIQYSQSEGLNLQHSCNVMNFYTYDYSYLNFDQMCGRIYRNGQDKHTIFRVYKNKGTIEDRVWYAIKHKQSTEQYMKGVLSGE